MDASKDKEGLVAIIWLGLTGSFLYAVSRKPSANRIEVQPGQYLNIEAAESFNRMFDAAKSSNINLKIVSSFRTSARQTEIWARAIKRYRTEKEARKWAAKPGESTHQKGLAVDIKLSPDILNDSSNIDALEKTSIYTWLSNHANQFGFIRSPTEPWHWYLKGR